MDGWSVDGVILTIDGDVASTIPNTHPKTRNQMKKGKTFTRNLNMSGWLLDEIKKRRSWQSFLPWCILEIKQGVFFVLRGKKPTVCAVLPITCTVQTRLDATWVSVHSREPSTELQGWAHSATTAALHRRSSVHNRKGWWIHDSHDGTFYWTRKDGNLIEHRKPNAHY